MVFGNNIVSRSWVFTLNNPGGPLDFDPFDRIRYAIYQRESGARNTEHYQGYIELSSPATLRFMQRVIPGAHFERRRGTRQQARDYARKEETRIGTVVEFGTWTGGQGTRSDLIAVRRRIDAGDSEIEIAEQFFGTWCRNYRAFNRYKRLKLSKSNPTPIVTVIWGPTGVGKSRYCFDKYPNAYWKMPNSWWCGYEGQSVIILDDFYGWLPLSMFLRLLDRYPVLMETKGGQTTRTTEEIIITSNRPPEEWYKWPTEEIRLALLRRITNSYNIVNKCNELICVDTECQLHGSD